MVKTSVGPVFELRKDTRRLSYRVHVHLPSSSQNSQITRFFKNVATVFSKEIKNSKNRRFFAISLMFLRESKMDNYSIPVFFFFFFFQRTKNRCLFNSGIFFQKNQNRQFFSNLIFFPKTGTGTSLIIQRTAQHGVKTPEIRLIINKYILIRVSESKSNLTWVYFFPLKSFSQSFSSLLTGGLLKQVVTFLLQIAHEHYY
jgi:hypothetical protein